MKPELLFLTKTILVVVIWIFIDYRLYRWVGMSGIFGALKEDKIEDRIKGIAFGFSAPILVFGAIILLYYKLTNKYVVGFSYWLSIGILIVATVIINILSRICIDFYFKKEQIAQKDLIIFLSILGAIIVIAFGALIVAWPF